MRLDLAVADFRDRSYAPILEVFLRKVKPGMPPRNDRNDNTTQARIATAGVVANHRLCREHYRLTFRLHAFGEAGAGQFVHLCPELDDNGKPQPGDDDSADSRVAWTHTYLAPMLRRAFSIARLSRSAGAIDIDVVYRVVGAATRWMESLREGDRLSVLGPLGNRFPIVSGKSAAWMIAGGVGLPPMLWLAGALHQAGKRGVAFCGAQTADLLPLTSIPEVSPDTEAENATVCCGEFADADTPAVISTDDGSLGFGGHIGAAMEAYHQNNAVTCDDLVVYTCGPEAMMRFVAEYCVSRRIECYVCMERAMACGTGLCQSCVVPVSDQTDSAGWRYRLCCKDGPTFSAADVIWDEARCV